MNDQDIPITPSVVLFIEAISEAFPHRCVRLGESEIEAHRYAAVRDFIDELVAIKDEHMEGDNENTGDA
jgi:hypothetical protein